MVDRYIIFHRELVLVLDTLKSQKQPFLSLLIYSITFNTYYTTLSVLKYNQKLNNQPSRFYSQRKISQKQSDLQ